MPAESPNVPESFRRAYLIFLNGPLKGGRHLLRQPRFRVGRRPDCDLIPGGDLAARVSGNHLELIFQAGSWQARDLGSTNGTWLNGSKIETADLKEGDELMLGQKGPRFGWALDHSDTSVAETLIVKTQPELKSEKVVLSEKKSSPKSKEDAHSTLLLDAVKRAREARLTGDGGETAVIMREVLSTVIVRSRKKLKITIGVLLTLLVLVCSWSIWTIGRLAAQKDQIDLQITQIEVDLQNADDPEKIKALLADLDSYQLEAREIQKNLLYQIGARDEETDFVENEIRALMAEFGAPEYSIPPEFSQKVRFYIRRFSGKDRGNMARALGPAKDQLQLIQSKLVENHLPPDLAYIVVVESGFRFNSKSGAGAAGPWQFVPITARGLGLRVDSTVDERYDVEKSTIAAARYLRKLIADFGAGQSFMLALAAYNMGPTKVRRIIRRVENPIKQRDFWYLYRTRAFPEETREYVPKIFAAIIVGRNPERFGFQQAEKAAAS